MTDEYRAAWSAFDARRPANVDASALHEIDRGAAAVRAALRQDPDARYLFDRLQSLYAQRLDLSRRLSTSTLPTRRSHHHVLPPPPAAAAGGPSRPGPTPDCRRVGKEGVRTGK